MEVRLADCAGFCFGVKRAVDTVYEQLKTGRLSIPMVPSCIMRKWSGNWRKRSKSSGKQRRTKNLKAGETIPTVIIRAHGVAKEIYDIMEANGLECIDATCPFVKRSIASWNKKHRRVPCDRRGGPETSGSRGYRRLVSGPGNRSGNSRTGRKFCENRR